jgi:hypothetical protein
MMIGEPPVTVIDSIAACAIMECHHLFCVRFIK